MSVIPEAVIQRAIVNGIREVRQNDKLFNDLFKHLTQEQLQDVKTFIRDTKITFVVNYPRNTELQVPALNLVLKSDEEGDTFLGDHKGTRPVWSTPDDENLEFDEEVLGGGFGASVANNAGLPKKLAGPLNVVDSTATLVTLVDPLPPELVGTAVNRVLQGMEIYVIKGTGVGQRKKVVRTSSTTLDIEGSFSVLLDGTSEIVLRSLPSGFETVGEPAGTYPSGATNVTRTGANYNAVYQLDVVCGQQEEVLYLYTIIKAILYIHKMFLEKNGIMNLQISGADFAPRSDYGPDTVFHRILNLRFKYPFDVLEETTQPTSLVLSIVPFEGDTIPLGEFEI